MPIRLKRWIADGEDPVVAEYHIPGTLLPNRGAVFSFSVLIAAHPDVGVLVAPEYEYVRRQYTPDRTEEATVWLLPTTDTPYTEREKAKGGRGGFNPAGGEMIEPPILPHEQDIMALFSSGAGDVWLQLAPRDPEARAIRMDRLNAGGRRTRAIWYPARYVSSVCSDGDRVWVLGMTDEGLQIQCMRMTSKR